MMMHPSQQLFVGAPEFGAGQQNANPSSYVSFNGVTEVRVGVRKNTLLQTAKAVISNGETQIKMRLLFDICAQHSFINEEVCQKLRLPTKRRDNMVLNAFEKDSSEKRKLRVVSLKLKGCHGPVSVELYVVPRICAPLHGQTIELAQQSFSHLFGLKLADSSLNCPTLSIDILIGGDFYWSFFTGRISRGVSTAPVAMESSFGWVLSGSMEADSSSSSSVNVVTNSHTLMIPVADRDAAIVEKVHEFWDLENAGLKTREEEVLDNFNETVSFDGKNYTVRLPFCCDPSVLADNFSLSQKRLSSSLRKMSETPDKLKAYDNVIRNWEKEGIIESVERGVDTDKPKHYFPHHGVENYERATTKLRVCMDASAHIRNHPSMNEVLGVGKCMLPRLFDILIRFRCWMYALISDMKQAFLQIRIDERDRDYLRFLWVDDISKEIPTIVAKRFTSVLFGLKSSPFLLAATLEHHANKYKDSNPEFVEMFLRDLYVDDNTTGVNDVNTGFEYYLFVRFMLLEGGFVIRKWFSNSNDLFQRINHHEETFYQEPVVIPNDESLRKVLGVKWDGSTDTLVFSLQEIVLTALTVTNVSKCNVLSIISGIFDPLGILAALVIILKFLFQEVCAMKVEWDATLPQEFTSRWISALQFLSSFEPIRLPRHYLQGNDLSSALKVELHGFCDASVKAIAAVLYLRTVFEDKAVCTIVTGKTKVVPLHKRKAPKR